MVSILLLYLIYIDMSLLSGLSTIRPNDGQVLATFSPHFAKRQILTPLCTALIGSDS
jgi:hypothetical protein